MINQKFHMSEADTLSGAPGMFINRTCEMS